MWERSTEAHNGHPNFETWAFWTHVTQTETLLWKALTITGTLAEKDCHPVVVGEAVVSYFKEWARFTTEDYTSNEGNDSWDDARLMLADVGSWWRIDEAHIGQHLIDYWKDSR